MRSLDRVAAILVLALTSALSAAVVVGVALGKVPALVLIVMLSWLVRIIDRRFLAQRPNTPGPSPPE